MSNAVRARLHTLQGKVEERLAEWQSRDLVDRFWNLDPALWTQETKEFDSYSNRLGWVHVWETMAERVRELDAFSREVLAEDYQAVAILGMGGSSLGAEVLRDVVGVQDGCPEFHVLDSTHPDAVGAFLDKLAGKKTLFLISSKSGATIEVLSLFRHLSDRFPGGENFVAVTDPGTPLETLAGELHFRQVFLNPPDIGGRFSALSLFGLVPASLMGLDLPRLLRGAGKMANLSRPQVAIYANPAIFLGALLAESARVGFHHWTFFLGEKWRSVGDWLEQLLAESLGKRGKGIFPVVGEPIGRPEEYGPGRLFVGLNLEEEQNENFRRLENAGLPCVSWNASNPYDLGGEFLRWEIATALCGAELGINPFDQPDVESAKCQARAVLREGILLSDDSSWERAGGLAWRTREGSARSTSLAEALSSHWKTLGKDGFIGLLHFFPLTEREAIALSACASLLRAKFRVPVTVNAGPRYLHSTGQFHKGGLNKGVYVVLMGEGRRDLQVPGEAWTLGELNRSQAVGDYLALRNAGRHAMLIDLGQDYTSKVPKLENEVRESISAPH